MTNKGRQDLKTKIMLDTVVTPTTVISLGAGLTLLMLSLILGGYTALLGFTSCLVGVGALIWNFLFNFENIKRKAAQEWAAQAKEEHGRRLDALDAKLVKTRDGRDQTALRDLRVMYSDLQKELETGRINRNVSPEMLAQVDDIFEACVHQLENSYSLWETTRKGISEGLRRQLQEQRDAIIIAVQESVANMAVTINEIRAIRNQTDVRELQALSVKLSRQLDTAKRIEEQFSSLNSDDEAAEMERFKEYVE